VSFVELESRGHVGTITLNRPEAMNAISGDVADELAGASLQTAADPNVWAIILRAAGDRAFSVGADLKERGRLDERGWLRNRSLMRAMFDSIRAVPQPTIASVFGYALGGGFELALSCDLIVAADDAVFGLPEVTVGIVPGGGGTQLLARRIGPARAKELIFTGARVGAKPALDMGFVAAVVARDSLDSETLQLAERICRSSSVAVREAKRAIDWGWEVPLEHGIELEDQAWRRAVASEDRVEGIAAWREKREPRWKGR